MKKTLLLLSIIAGSIGSVWAGTFYDSPNLSTQNASSLANMGVAGTFNFYSSTIMANRTNPPPLTIGTTNGIYAPNGLGIEMATGTFRSWVKTASITVSVQLKAAVIISSDGSRISNLSTGTFSQGDVANATATLSSRINAVSNFTTTTSVAVDRFNSFNSTSQTKIDLFISYMSTNTARQNIAFSSITSLWTSFYTYSSTSDARFGILSSSISSAYSNMSIYESTADARFSILSASIATAYSNMSVYEATDTARANVLSSSITSIWNNFYAFSATAAARDNSLAISTANLQNFIAGYTSTSDVKSNAVLTFESTATARDLSLGVSTQNLQSAFTGFASTVQTRIDGLQTFTSTVQIKLDAINASTTSIGTRILNGAISVYAAGAFLGNVNTVNWSTGITVNVSGSTATVSAPISLISTNTWSASQTFTSSTTLSSSTLSIGGVVSYFQSTVPASGDLILHRISGSSVAYWGGGSGSGSGGLPSLRVMPNNVAISTANFPPGDFTIRYDGTAGATITVKDSSGPWTAAQTFIGSVTISDPGNPITPSSLLFSVARATFNVNNTGNVGIGVSSASSKLDIVNGSITVRGTGTGIRISGLANISNLATDSEGNFVSASLGTVNKGYKAAEVYLSTTAGLVNQADILSSVTTGFIRALELLGAAGLTNSATAQGTIIVSPGIYDVSGVTIPAGVMLWCQPGSSIVYRNSSSSGTMMFVYGSVINGFVDGQNNQTPGQIFNIKTGGRVDGVTTYGMGNFNQLSSPLVHSIFYVADSSDVVIRATCLDGSPLQQDMMGGGILTVLRSSWSSVNISARNSTPGLTTGKQFLYFLDAVGITVTGNYRDVGERWFLVNGNSARITFDKCKIHVARAPPTSGSVGILGFRADNHTVNSSCTVQDCEIRNESGSTQNFIGLSGSTFENIAIVFRNNTYYGDPSVSPTTFATLSAKSTRTIFIGNQVYNATFISDSGTGTAYTGNDNFKDGVEN